MTNLWIVFKGLGLRVSTIGPQLLGLPHRLTPYPPSMNLVLKVDHPVSGVLRWSVLEYCNWMAPKGHLSK